jgi:hypothetical protein
VALGERTDPFEWGGSDIGGPTANLDAAMAEHERRHNGTDDGRHHRVVHQALSPHQMVVRMTEFGILFRNCSCSGACDCDWREGP